MTTQQENVSALMDGEHDNDSVFDALQQDDQLRATWNRYHIARSTLRKEMPQGAVLDISAAVAEAIAEEPTVLAPGRSSKWANKLRRAAVPFARQSSQFAVAASVAVALVLGVQTFNQPEPTEPFSTAPTMSPTGGLAPVSLEQTRALQTQDRSAMLEKRRHINALLADHEQQVKLKSDDEKEESSQDPENQPKP